MTGSEILLYGAIILLVVAATLQEIGKVGLAYLLYRVTKDKKKKSGG